MLRAVLAYVFGQLIVAWCWLCFGLGHTLCWVGDHLNSGGWALRDHVRWWRHLLRQIADEKREEARRTNGEQV